LLLELGQELVGVLGKGKRLAALVPPVAEAADRGYQLVHAGEVAPTYGAWRWMIAKKASTRLSQEP
jgi:hypothetical protein